MRGREAGANSSCSIPRQLQVRNYRGRVAPARARPSVAAEFPVRRSADRGERGNRTSEKFRAKSPDHATNLHRCCPAARHVSVRASRLFFSFLWKAAETKAPSGYRSTSGNPYLCRGGERGVTRARGAYSVITRNQDLPPHGRMDKDCRRKCRRMRCALLHLLLIVGGKFHHVAQCVKFIADGGGLCVVPE